MIRRLIQALKPSSAALPPPILFARPSIMSSSPIEEERMPGYDVNDFHQITIGDTLHYRYKILAKLGYGISATVWLAKDLNGLNFWARRYVALKVLKQSASGSAAVASELAISKHIHEVSARNVALAVLRTIRTSFQLRGPKGVHDCLVYDPMREDLETLCNRMANRRIPRRLLKQIAKYMLCALAHLHERCHVVPTYLKPENILIALENDKVLPKLVENERNSPGPVKVCEGRVIHTSRTFGDYEEAPGLPKLADFGHAVRDIEGGHHHPIRPALYQAPEVELGAGWTYSADVWNFGVMVYELLEGDPLFDAHDEVSPEYMPSYHLAEMTSLLGPPPESPLQRGKSTANYFTSNRKLLVEEVMSIKHLELGSTIVTLSGEEKAAFARFILRMLRWEPTERATAAELVSDPWLHE